MAYRQLTIEEREVISQMLYAGCRRTEIAARLGRDVETIRREIARNSVNGQYSAAAAQRLADQRRRRARAASYKMNNPLIAKYVKEGLRLFWSPDQIAGRMRMDFPENSRQRISAQSIYAWLARDDHRRAWLKFLRHYRWRKRRPNKRAGSSSALVNRPEIVNRRERFGDWEGDTIVGPRRGGGALVSLVERLSGYLALAKVPDLRSHTVNRAIAASLEALPRQLRLTMTFDNGPEFRRPDELSRWLGLAIYFADPYCSWQRGTCENTNGLTRQFFPKGTNFRGIRHTEVAHTQTLLNERPRKRLGYQTPKEILLNQLTAALQT